MAEKKITFLDELPPLADLEQLSRAERPRAVIENFNNRAAPYATFSSMGGGGGPAPEAPKEPPMIEAFGKGRRPNEDDPNAVKEQMMVKAVQKFSPSPDPNNMAMHMDLETPPRQQRLVHYRPHHDDYKIPDDSYIIYEEPSTLIPAYHVKPPKQRRHRHISRRTPPPPLAPPPAAVDQPCRIIYNHLRSCALCSRLYGSGSGPLPLSPPAITPPPSTTQQPSSSSPKCTVGGAILVLVIIFLLMLCTAMARRIFSS